MNTILLTGATSLIGKEFVRHCLASKNYNLILVANPSSMRNYEMPECDVSVVECDLMDGERLTRVLKEVSPDVIVHIAQMKFSNIVVKSMLSAGVESWLIVVGSTKIYSRLRSVSSIYKENEVIIRSWIKKFTIIRPTMIYGSLVDKNVGRLIEVIRKGNIVPLINGGIVKYQPIHYEDVAQILFNILKARHSVNEEIDIGGPEIITTRNLVSLCGAKLVMRTRTITVDLNLLLRLTRLIRSMGILRNQFDLLEELCRDKDIDRNDAHRYIGHMIGLSEGIEGICRDILDV